MAKKIEKSEKEIREEVERRLKEIELLREEARQQGQAFSGLSEEELVKKIKGETSNSPYIYSMGWTSGTTSGSTANFTVYISNPDPTGYYPMFASIFFGVANFLDDIGEGLSGRDTKWPYLSSAPFSIAASGATANKSFSYVVPTGIAPSTYLGNVVVWRGELHDKGVYFDRGMFYITVT
jgi:hypothetical protein